MHPRRKSESLIQGGGIERVVQQLINAAIRSFLIGVTEEPVATAVILGLIVGAATSSLSGFIVGVAATYLVARVLGQLSDSA